MVAIMGLMVQAAELSETRVSKRLPGFLGIAHVPKQRLP